MERSAAPAALPLAPIAFLVGVWEGEGKGLWPADPPFVYRERVEITCDGRPFLRYEQQTVDLEGRPRHTEVGYLRCPSPEAVEALIVQATGICEVAVGPVADNALDLRSTTVALAPTAKRVTAIARRLWVVDDALHYLVRIAMNDEPLADHLSARLLRVG